MRIKHRIAFGTNGSRAAVIWPFLERHGINPEGGDSRLVTVVNVFEDEPYWNELKELLVQSGTSSLPEMVFSPTELAEAEWLRVRTKTRSGYPQPEEGYEGITYDDTNYCLGCGFGLVQSDSFRMKAVPSWGRRNFMKMHWVDELFVTDAVREELTKHNLKGVSFRPVLHSRKLTPLENTHQLVVEKELQPGLIKGPEAISEEYHCAKCGYTKYTLPGRRVVQIKEAMLDESYDIVWTAERFGPGRMCARLILISQRLHRILKDKGWDKDLKLEPFQVV